MKSGGGLYQTGVAMRHEQQHSGKERQPAAGKMGFSTTKPPLCSQKGNDQKQRGTINIAQQTGQIHDGKLTAAIEQGCQTERSAHYGSVTEAEQREQGLQQADGAQQSSAAQHDKQKRCGDIHEHKPLDVNAGKVLNKQTLSGHEQTQQ